MIKLIGWKFFETKELTNEEILFRLNRTVWTENPEIKTLQLEDSNFWIDSKGWKTKVEDWIKVKVNSEWDIWEFAEWEFKWEQLFTWDAAMRETEKAGKKIPTRGQWEELIEQDKEFILNLPKVGYRNSSIAYYYYQGTYGSYWSSSPTGASRVLCVHR